MIEPDYAGRLGFSEEFRPGEESRAEQAARSLQDLGIRHLRLRLREDVLQDQSAADFTAWLLHLFAPACQLLISLEADAGQTPALLQHLLDAHGSAVEAVEIRAGRNWPDAGLPAAAAAATLASAHAKKLVLGVPANTPANALAQAAQAGALAGIHAIGLRARLAAAPHQTLAATLQAWRAALQESHPGLPVWITQTGFPTWHGGEAAQAQAFLDALATDAPRLYWAHVIDSEDREHPPTGLHDRHRQPKLLGRLLAGGVGNLGRVLASSRRLPAPAILGTRPLLITGGAGFIGANLADRLAALGHPVLLFDALARQGVERNLAWLAKRHPARISATLGDVRDDAALREAAGGAAAIFHLAGQVAVTTSMARPAEDFAVNAGGTLALLEAVRRHNPQAPLVFASTNKVYGDLNDIALEETPHAYQPADPALREAGVNESRKLCFQTPYGCSKGAADQYVLDYAHSFGLRTAVLRMSCIYGERQLGTEDQGWVAHFLLKALAGQPIVIYGDGKQVRDVLHVGDAVRAYLAAWNRIDAIAGRAYNLGGGPANAISLRQLIAYLETLLGRAVPVAHAGWRPGDQRYFVADTQAARRDLSLPPALDWRSGVRRLAEHFGAALAPGTSDAGAEIAGAAE
jgi:CDP-paratose 2-epimerase